MTALKRSWIDSANDPDTPFPLNNLPYGVFETGAGDARQGTAIGDKVLDLASLEARGTLDFGGTLQMGRWNDFMARGKAE